MTRFRVVGPLQEHYHGPYGEERFSDEALAMVERFAAQVRVSFAVQRFLLF